jgi:peptidoglycan/xylan/chitin deacetylase (PgdA/CDA1 family)
VTIVRRQLRRAADNAVSSLLPLVWYFQRTPRLLVLMYHRVLPPGHPDLRSEQPGMYVSPATLAMHLELLRRHEFNLVHLDDWLEAAGTATPLAARSCAITFDDGWRDNYDYAYPILKRASAPATIYLVSDLVGTQYSFWPNSLARVLAKYDAALLDGMPHWLRQCVLDASGGVTAGTLDPEKIDAVIMGCKATHSDAEMLAVVCRLEATQPGAAAADARDLMSWEEIHEMRSNGLVRFGSHTRRHTRLAGAASAEVLQDEVIGSRQAIERQLGTPPATFCYPNGDTSPQAIDIVRSAYRGAVTTRKGWHLAKHDPFLIRRVGMHEDIGNRPAAFLARIGAWP